MRGDGLVPSRSEFMYGLDTGDDKRRPYDLFHAGLVSCQRNAGARGRNRTGTELPPRDFKSLVSTCFTTRAKVREA